MHYSIDKIFFNEIWNFSNFLLTSVKNMHHNSYKQNTVEKRQLKYKP